jgi:2-C-methyl-D-erythritol 4-phosphate cytidylyltransferase
MFTAMGRTQDSILDAMSRSFEPWVARMIAESKYASWIASDDGRPIASAGLLILDWPPHPLDTSGDHRGYLLNVFVEPEYRKRGLAHALVDLCLAEARRRRIRVVALHTSDQARPIYEAFGFRSTNEMFYVEPVEGSQPSIGPDCHAQRHPLYTPPVMQVFVILPAAGLGTRMAGPQPKQFVALNGIPILVHSLRAFAAVERVTAIYVAVRKPEMERVRAQVAEYGFADRVRVVEGGDNRQESVAHALAALPAQPDDIVLVHDAVRPLIDVATIERTIDAVAEHGAAIVGMPAVDTIKQVERTAHGALITSTIPREFVVLAQTPQGFRYSLLQQAFAEATEDGFVGTDEASVVERAGHPVAVVHGSQVNLKITQPGDLELAEFYLGQRAR